MIFNWFEILHSTSLMNKSPSTVKRYRIKSEGTSLTVHSTLIQVISLPFGWKLVIIVSKSCNNSSYIVMQHKKPWFAPFLPVGAVPRAHPQTKKRATKTLMVILKNCQYCKNILGPLLEFNRLHEIEKNRTFLSAWERTLEISLAFKVTATRIESSVPRIVFITTYHE